MSKNVVTILNINITVQFKLEKRLLNINFEI